MTHAAAALCSFEDYRDRILSIMALGQAHMPVDPPADTGDLDLARMRIARVLTAYHLYAQRELFNPCAAAADPADRARVRRVERECATLVNDFRAFTRACMAQPVSAHWADYRAEAAAMMQRIRAHLVEAEQEVRFCEQLYSAEPVATADAA